MESGDAGATPVEVGATQLRLVSHNLNLLAPNKLVVLLQSSPHVHLQVKNQLVGKFHQFGIILIE